MASRLHRKFFATILPVAVPGVFVLGIFVPAAFAAGTQTRSFTLADHGSLAFTAPASWRHEIKPAEGRVPPTIVFRPSSGRAFKLMIAPIVPPRRGMPMPSLDEIRDDVEQGKAKAAPEAVEKNIVVHKLRGPHAAGYYFTATDKSPGAGPDDYRMMTPAEVRVGRALLVVTVFYNDDSGRVREQALAMLRSARYHASKQGIAIKKIKTGYEVTVPASALVLTLVEPHLKRAAGPQAGAANEPGYFYFHDSARGLIVSGWFEPAASYPGLKPFWKNETGAWKKNELLAPQHVAFKKIGGWDAIVYNIKMPIPKATDTHIRAERVQAGTWIDLHLSVTSSQPADKVRAKLENILNHMRVKKK